LVEDHVTGRVRVCAEDNGANISTSVHVVNEVVITDRQQDLRALNFVMMDAYLYDNIDYFYVVYKPSVKPNNTDGFHSSSLLSIR